MDLFIYYLFCTFAVSCRIRTNLIWNHCLFKFEFGVCFYFIFIFAPVFLFAFCFFVFLFWTFLNQILIFLFRRKLTINWYFQKAIHQNLNMESCKFHLFSQILNQVWRLIQSHQWFFCACKRIHRLMTKIKDQIFHFL